MNNLISKCFVIWSTDLGAEPVIYLREPEVDASYETVIPCDNAWEAKALIIKSCLISYQKIHVTISKYSIVSQLPKEHEFKKI